MSIGDLSPGLQVLLALLLFGCVLGVVVFFYVFIEVWPNWWQVDKAYDRSLGMDSTFLYAASTDHGLRLKKLEEDVELTLLRFERKVVRGPRLDVLTAKERKAIKEKYES